MLVNMHNEFSGDKIDKGVDSVLARPGCSSSLAEPEPGWCGPAPAPALVTGAGPGCQAVYSVTIIADTRHNICNISPHSPAGSPVSLAGCVVSELSLRSLVREPGSHYLHSLLAPGLCSHTGSPCSPPCHPGSGLSSGRGPLCRSRSQ